MNSFLVFAVVVGVLATGCMAGTIPLVSSPFLAASAPVVAPSAPVVAAPGPFVAPSAPVIAAGPAPFVAASAPVVAAGAPVAFASPVGYANAVPYNVPPYASRIDLSSKTLAAPYIAAPVATLL